ncbi:MULTISPECIES: MBL fold metallo-hydrolase [Paraliobacillus]|uniref:MBL fold metallo-hydrolase n=1 Tax=Paraliobacillus TaxID=200903 RepID=UPI000DD2D608|nr:MULTISPECIES: MBL fold metallo-hydrolase [Paraliobacillus]
MSKTTITFWSGLQTIGGNIAEIRYGNARVIFDFGLVYNPSTSFVHKATGRSDRYVLDLLKIGAIPAIDGIYAREDLKDNVFNFKKPIAYEDFKMNTGIFISHLHLDHMGVIDTVASTIPIYMSNGSKQLYQVLNKINEGLMRERDVTGINYQDSIKIGDIIVTPFQTDHDIYGSMAMLISTPDLKVVYSGDIRMHGQHPEYNKAWLEKLLDINIDLLLMEGTAFHPNLTEKTKIPLVETETEIAQVIKREIINHNRLVLFNIYHRNIDRLNNFIKTGKQCERTIVLELKTAYIADQFAEVTDFAIFVPNDSKESDWNQNILEKYPRVTIEQINATPNKYLLQNSFDNIADLLDLDVSGSIYLHSNGMPLGEFDPNYQILLSFLKQFQIEYKSFNVSGHATQEDILQLIEDIKPKLLVPWHSHYPELMKPLDPNQAVFLPRKNKKYFFDNGQLIEV